MTTLRVPDGTDPVLRLRTPTDVVEAVPLLLGFHPDSSLVVIALRPGPAGRSRVRCTARVDLPEGPASYQDLAEQLAGLLGRHRVTEALLVVFAGPPATVSDLPHQKLVEVLSNGLADIGVATRDALCVAGQRLRSYWCTDRSCCPTEGRPVPVKGTSAVAAATVLAGVAPFPSRAALAASLEPVDPAAASAMAEAVKRAAAAFAVRRLDPQFRSEVVARIARAAETLGRGAACLADGEVAWLLVSLPDVLIRDECLTWSDGPRGEGLQSLEVELVRRAVPPYAVTPAAMLAVTAYVRGDGALAWVAADRALAADPGHRLTRLLSVLAAAGIDPAELAREMKQGAALSATGAGPPASRIPRGRAGPRRRGAGAADRPTPGPAR